MKYRRRLRPLLGTFVEIGVSDGAGADQAIASAFAEVATIQRLLSFHDPESDLSRLNHAQGRPVTWHRHSLIVLRLARAIHRRSGGLFDPSVGACLVRLGILPWHGASAPGLGSIETVIVRGTEVTATAPVSLTFDGIAKGFAVDQAIKCLARQGLASGWVNAGGDLRVFGDVALPVQRHGPDRAQMLQGELRNAAMATSIVKTAPDQRFPGWITAREPAVATPGVWTVIARSTWLADALTKVAALAEAGTRQALIEGFGARLLPQIGSNP